MSTPVRHHRVRAAALILAALLVCAWPVASSYYSLPPLQFVRQAARVVLTPVYSLVYRADRTHAEQLTQKYWVGLQSPPTSVFESWQRIGRDLSGFHVVTADTPDYSQKVPFVYETPTARYLQSFRQRYRLDEVVSGAATEYDAMLRLGAWLGTRWDHGTDTLPGTSQVCDPAAVVAAGEAGARYWCEIAARTMVQAATSLGWPARVITASRDGYTWEHAVAELWSNQFSKWFVVDTDFNVVYESAGIPLSAFELSHEGERLQHSGHLVVRVIAPPKPSLPLKDVLPFYAYVHVDLRNDWCSRALPGGSPAGGDQSTWWTARPDFPPVLTAKTRVDAPAKFDWKVNQVGIYAAAMRRIDAQYVSIRVALRAYAPMFKAFAVKVDTGSWLPVQGETYDMRLAAGQHTITARVLTSSGYPGPESRVEFRF